MDIVLSIITINYNGLKDTCELIETLPLYDSSIEVIVVDNASREDEASEIERRYPAVKVIRSDRNLGFAGGNNLGIKAARGQYIFLINNDTVFKEDGHMDTLIQRLNTSEKIGAVCPKIRFAWGNHSIQFAGFTPLSTITLRNRSIGYGEEDQGQHDTAHPTPYAHGAAMMLKREVIDQVGLMPECYFLYYEELDWSMMLTRAGYDIWYEPACTIYHKESQATGQDSPLKTYYLTRNRLLLVKRNFHGLKKYLSYCYLMGPVALRDIIKYTLKGPKSLLRATLTGLRDFRNSHFSILNTQLS
ncbi:MAG: glycosyltransferase family 2 protein [Prevotella sp.]|nr:glycosyltransferase family 2 protein [Prevotella sp.]